MENQLLNAILKNWMELDLVKHDRLDQMDCRAFMKLYISYKFLLLLIISKIWNLVNLPHSFCALFLFYVTTSEFRIGLVGFLYFTSHQQQGYLEKASPLTVLCEGREAGFLHRSHRESYPGLSRGSPLH